MTSFEAIAQAALAKMPPEDRFNEADAAVIASHRAELLALSELLTQRFYDTLFAHEPTRAVFHDGERPEREASLKQWWQRTVEGPFDDGYWRWQASVGLLHVKRKVYNPMMLGHAGLISRLIAEQLNDTALATAVIRLMATVAAVIAEGYETIYLDALSQATGQSRALIAQNVALAVDELTKEQS